MSWEHKERTWNTNPSHPYFHNHHSPVQISKKSSWKAKRTTAKLDMTKAYDWMEWVFLESMLIKKGLSEHIIKLFMECVRSARYQVSPTGKDLSTIFSSKGIRQDDPRSSYLLLICIKGFSNLIHDFERENLVKRIEVACRALSLTHTFFADDTYIFCKTKYEVVSQMVRLSK